MRQIVYNPEHCLHNLLLTERDQCVTGRLRCADRLPRIFAKTNRLKNSFISPHGIAMPKGLYFTAVVFLSSHFFFCRRLISDVTERISTKLGHIFTYDCYWKNLVPTSSGIYPSPRAGGKKTAFMEPTLNFDRTYLCNVRWYQQSERNLSLYKDSFTSPQGGINDREFGPNVSNSEYVSTFGCDPFSDLRD